MLRTLIALSLLATPAFASSTAAGSVGALLPNPASVFCSDELDGDGVRMTSAEGEWAFCKVGDAMIEEWTLYRSLSGEGARLERAVAAFLAGETDCAAAGGTVASDPSPTTAGTISYCQFDDRSTIELATLKAGPSAPQNARMLAAIRALRGE